MVEYHSVSMGSWIPAKLIRAGGQPGTFDLDCKDAVDIKKIRLPGGGGGASSYSGGGCGGGGGSGASGGARLQIQMGSLCFYKSSTHGWIPAKVMSQQSPEVYDLDVKPGVPAQSVYPLMDGVMVEYHSASSNSWIPARIMSRGAEQATFDLDCKPCVAINKIRPHPEGPGVGASGGDTSGGGAGGALAWLGSMFGGGNDAMPPAASAGKGSGKGSFGASGYSETIAGGGKGGYGGGGPAPKRAAGPGGGKGSGAAPLWRYVPADGRHMDLRTEPLLDGERASSFLSAGDVFCVDKEQQGRDGVLYLRLADGRGWSFDHKPAFGAMCQRFQINEDDGPGPYVVINEHLAVTAARSRGGDGDIIGKLAVGTPVVVQEVVPLPDQQRIRARIEHPAGWITLFSMQTGVRCAIKMPRKLPGAPGALNGPGFDTGALQQHQSCMGVKQFFGW
eukprot:TRINITY_DN66146_c0_g1_i1.p1 TRINITY_DN66146_c0_g1~~TRINITY_DN66146_c0_g1_i1.p1  ORF type:complete len:514 (+),score=109.84 TRINITY_DN66146_c0_g1_i1:201-1544(+)